MEPFALLKMMGTFVANGMTGRIVLYLLLLAAGVGVRCVLQRLRKGDAFLLRGKEEFACTGCSCSFREK